MSRALALAALLVLPMNAPAATPPLDEAVAARFAALALDCVGKEYPNKIAHVLNSDADARPPRALTPVFYGCYDWHSAVHGHWMLVRLARLFPDAPFAGEARAAVARNITPAHVAAEVHYMDAPGRDGFERPYGLAWLLQLAAELREWEDSEWAAEMAGTLAPLEARAARSLSEWLPKLSHPIRAGEHFQTAFALGLVLDWARVAGDEAMEALVVTRARHWHLADRGCPLDYEPSGHDFLSPCLGEADLMRRVLAPAEYGDWLEAFMPGIPTDGDAAWLVPAVVTDPTDGKLAHLDGLNLSRAWMLEGVAAGLAPDDPRRAALLAAARAHAVSGLASVTGEHYEGGHWLGSFATYLVTGRGLPD